MKMINILVSILFVVFSTSAFSDENIDDLYKPKYPSDLVYGKDDAPIQVLEHYSLGCHHCSHFYLDVFPSLKKDYIDTGKVKWIKRSYALDNSAIKATMFLECVDKNRKESYLSILFRKQSNWTYQKDSVQILNNIANLGGMSSADFMNCVENKEREAAVIAAATKARESFKITGTPAFIINKELAKVYTEDSFREYFDKLLEKK